MVAALQIEEAEYARLTIDWIWPVTVLAAGLYCLIRGVLDLRQRRYVWGVLGLVLGGILLSMPIETHAVLVDLPLPPR